MAGPVIKEVGINKAAAKIVRNEADKTINNLLHSNPLIDRVFFRRNFSFVALDKADVFKSWIRYATKCISQERP